MRNKRSRKLVSILITLTMLVTLLVPMVGPAAASASYSTGSISKVQAGLSQNLGSIKVSIPSAELNVSANNSQYFTLRLPTDFNFNLAVNNADVGLNSVSSDTYSINNDTDVQIRIPAASNYLKNSANQNFRVKVTSENELKITLTGDMTANVKTDEDTAYFYVDLSHVLVASGFTGDISAIIEGQSGSPFVDGTVVIATVGSGSTAISIDSVKTITTSLADIDILRLKEDRPGAFESGKYIKLKVPTGFKWDMGSASVSFNDGTKADGTALDNNIANGSFKVSNTDSDNRTLEITSNVTTGTAAYILIQGLKVKVDDETIAKTGDVSVNITGNASSTPSTLVVGTYGDYSVKTYAVGDVPTVVAGKGAFKNASSSSDNFTQIGEFAIEESVQGSLVKDRTISLTLSGGAKWWGDSGMAVTDANFVPGDVKDISIDSGSSKNYQGLIDDKWEIIGSAGDTAKLTVGGAKFSDECKAVFKNAKILVSPEASGDITMTVSGSAGVTGEFVVAHVQKPVTVKADGDLPNVVIGNQAQELAPIVLTENVAEALTTNRDANGIGVKLEFPAGVLPANPSKVEVTDGDIMIDQNSIGTAMDQNNNRWSVVFNIKSTSSTPSTIKISGVKVTTDRTVPEGELKVSVKGSAASENGGVNHEFAATSTVASGTVANCVTPAPNDQSVDSSFKIGDTKFTMNGVDKTMDVAPYLKNDRTYLPIRYVAEALGVADSNIMWNADDQTVVLIKNGSVVKLTIGSTNMLINGTTITMDAAPEIVDPGRTMLPLRWVAQALGADVQWDAATQTVTVK